MIDPAQIPDEVVKKLTMLLLGRSLNDKNVSIAIAATLSAWPGAQVNPTHLGWPQCLVLPLPSIEGDAT